jgi:hypothetical protein
MLTDARLGETFGGQVKVSQVDGYFEARLGAQ